MKIYGGFTPESILPPAPRAVALGIFDGVHLGHRKVITEAVGIPGTVSCVFTFGAGASALKPRAYTVTLPGEQGNLFASLGAEEWIQADFDAYRQQDPECFVRQTLCAQLHAVRVCCGYNFRFGKGGEGDAALLVRLCGQCGIAVTVTQPVCAQGEPVSSDRIRRLLEQGDVRRATRLLGHPFALTFPVARGRQLGRRMGVPTANQILPEGFILPKFGVYTCALTWRGVTYYGLSNIGVRPTVGGGKPVCETWLESFHGDLYGQTVTVVLTGSVRPERKFPSVQALFAQIDDDREAMRHRYDEPGIKAVLFDFDDTLQDRRVAFLKYADVFLDTYLPQMPPEKRPKLKETMLALNNGGYVDYLVYFSEMPKAVGVADPPSPEELFREYQMRFPQYTTLFADTLPVLAELREMGLMLGVVTNGPCVQQNRKLDCCGLRPLLDTALVSEQEGVGKPNPEIFRRAAARLGVAPAQCVFVGDHPQNDIAGAKAAGMHPVFMAVRERMCPDATVPTAHELSELPDIIRRINRKNCV